jgi:hypothetical protein
MKIIHLKKYMEKVVQFNIPTDLGNINKNLSWLWSE